MFATRRHHTGWITDILLLLLGIGSLYALWLGSYPLFTPDEGRYSEIAREMLVSGDYITPRLNGIPFLDKPILYYLLQATAIRWFGLTEWSLRFWPALIGVLGCINIYICGRLLYQRRTGIVASVLLATCPLYYGAAHYANLDLEVCVFVSNALLLFITGIQQPLGRLRTTLLLCAYIFAALATLTKGLIGIAFPMMIIGAWILLSGKWKVLREMHLLSGMLIYLLITAPWFFMVQKVNPQFLHYFFVLQQFSRFLTKADFNNQSAVWFYIPIIMAGFLPWTLFLLQAFTSHVKSIIIHKERSTSLFFLLWFLIVFTFFSIPTSKTVGYILPVFPALALITASYLGKNWHANTQGIRSGIYGYILFGLMVGIILLIAPTYNLIKIDVPIMPFSIMAGILLIVSSLFCLRLPMKPFSTIFLCITATTCIMLLFVVNAASSVNFRSIKPIADIINSQIKPQDEIITYYRYYQDLPIYLERRITIVADWNSRDIARYDNWQRELWYNMHYLDSSDWLIDKNTLKSRWTGNHRIFLLMHSDFYLSFLRDIKNDKHTKVFLLASLPWVGHESLLLLSNQPNQGRI